MTNYSFDSALRDHPEIDPGRFSTWVAERHAQIEHGMLIFTARQVNP